MTNSERVVTPPEVKTELGPQGPGFRVRVDNPQLLFKAIQFGVSGEIGRILLEKPIEGIEVNVRSGLEEFNYLAEVNLDSMWRHDTPRGTEQVTASVVKRYSDLMERGGNLIVTAPRGTRILIDEGRAIKRIIITAGIREEYISGKITQLVPAPKITPESFESATADFTEFLETYVREVYKQAKKPSPDEELVIKSPKQLLSRRGSQRLTDMTNPEELIGKIEIEKPNVSFDEIDAIAPYRTGVHEATQRVLATLLENMDGIVAKENVVVVASTNRLDAIEPALLRAGRFDRWVEVPLPDKDGRRQIFEIHMRKAEKIAGRDLFNHVNLDEIIAKTEKSSGADIAEIIRRSLEEKVRKEGIGQETGVITTEDIIKEIQGYERTRETKRTIGFRTSAPQREDLATPQ